jgi:transcriptional regulator with XRE-family HTH domain
MNKKKEISPEHQQVLDKIGAKLMKMRKESGLSYPKLAHQIGMNKNSYYLIEQSKNNFGLVNLMLILNYYGISLSEFLKDVDS